MESSPAMRRLITRKVLVASVLLIVFCAVPLWFFINVEIVDVLRETELKKVSKNLRESYVAAPRRSNSSHVLRKDSSETATPSSDIQVPNIVHYVHIGELKYRHFLSILSVQRYLKPEKIIIHTDVDDLREQDNPDTFQAWRLHLKSFGNIEVSIRSFDYSEPGASSLLARVEILKTSGGIYLDTDVMVLENLEELRKYGTVVGAHSRGPSDSIILSRANSSFVNHWSGALQMYKKEGLALEQALPRLCVKYPKLVHLEENSFWFNVPGLANTNAFLSPTKNFSRGRKFAAVKLYHDFFGEEYREHDIKHLNTTFGEIARMVYYGTPVLLPRFPKLARPIVVPNIVHYIWYHQDCGEKFNLYHYLSMLSAVKIQKAEEIVFHCDQEPMGEWWNKAKDVAAGILRISKDISSITEIFGHPLKQHHRSDVARLQVLKNEGGIYINPDAVFVKKLTPFQENNFTIALDILGLNNGVILSKPGADFLQKYIDSYKNYQENRLYENSRVIPHEIATKNANSLYIETSRFTRPRWNDFWDPENLWRQKEKTDWSHMCVIQLMSDYHKVDYSLEDIEHMDSTFGEIARFILSS